MVRKTKYKWNFPPSPFYEVLNFGHFEQKHEFSESIYKTVFLPSILFCVVSGSKVFIYLQNIELILKICIFFFTSFVLFQGCFEFCKKKWGKKWICGINLVLSCFLYKRSLLCDIFSMIYIYLQNIELLKICIFFSNACLSLNSYLDAHLIKVIRFHLLQVEQVIFYLVLVNWLKIIY